MNNYTYGFIGLGLIGGSLARSIRKQAPESRIMAYTRTRRTLEEAMDEGVIDSALTGASDPALAQCDVIILCAPVATNIEYLKTMKGIVSEKALITDVGSVKSGIHQAVIELGLEKQFIGGHPMTGSEKTGLANSTDHLFENAYYIITPTPQSDPARVKEYEAAVKQFGALPLVLDYKEHDFITSAVSHLPHMIASSLVNTVHNLDGREEHMKLIAAGGFKDITRIASSSPDMWESICVDNRENISRVMDEFIRLLEEARDHMNEKDGSYIYHMFERSRDYRDSFNSRNMGSIKKVYGLYVDVADEPGAIATIATLLSVMGISIKNIGIVNNREFEEGVLSIIFGDEETTQKAAEILHSHRYQVWERK